MIKVVTTREMQNIDRMTIGRYGISGIVLMERAGLGVVRRINEIYFQGTPRETKNAGRKVIVLCGGGNNGGDGFVIARVLHNQGKEVEVYVTVRPATLKGDAKIYYDAARKFGVTIHPVKNYLTRYSSRSKSNCLIVDALLGTGLSREVRPPLTDVIGNINRMGAPVVSVDIPSGISSDTGRIMGCAVKAQWTVTFGLPKRGHLLYPGAEYTGKLCIEDIGFPLSLLASEKIRTNVLQKEDIASLLPERRKYSHKGTYGHVLIVAGSRGKTGAALMAARACLRSGAGLVTIGIPDRIVNSIQSRVTEEMVLPLPDKGNGTLSRTAADEIITFINKRGNVLAIGPGLSVNREISGLVSLLIKESRIPMVIDADGLNAIADKPHVLKKRRAPTILTPHLGEMARLLWNGEGRRKKAGVTDVRSMGEEIEKDRINIALAFAKKMKSFLVLKGVPTIIATPEGKTFINSTGNPGMATAGTGDVLTGMISAFLAQGLTPQDASIMGVYIHGHIGDIVAEKMTQQSLIASDIIEAIPKVFKSF